jgi:hypothetical protein
LYPEITDAPVLPGAVEQRIDSLHLFDFFVLYLFKRHRGSATVGIVLSRRVER